MVFRGFHTVDIFDCPPFQLFTNGDDPASAEILQNRSFEPHSMRLWCRLARNATSILDIGAHVGVYSLSAASLRQDLQIHAFEPNPFVAARLRVNKYLNGFENIVEHNVALSHERTTSTLSWIRRPDGWLNSGSALVGAGDSLESAAVQVETADSFHIAAGARALVKIDVEGSELGVFAGMQDFLRARPTIILETFLQAACDRITPMLPDYRFFLIEESGGLVESDRLVACDTKCLDKNQLLVPRERGLTM
jgi:FkbM family methyltransferase